MQHEDDQELRRLLKEMRVFFAKSKSEQKKILQNFIEVFFTADSFDKSLKTEKVESLVRLSDKDWLSDKAKIGLMFRDNRTEIEEMGLKPKNMDEFLRTFNKSPQVEITKRNSTFQQVASSTSISEQAFREFQKDLEKIKTDYTEVVKKRSSGIVGKGRVALSQFFPRLDPDRHLIDITELLRQANNALANVNLSQHQERMKIEKENETARNLRAAEPNTFAQKIESPTGGDQFKFTGMNMRPVEGEEAQKEAAQLRSSQNKNISDEIKKKGGQVLDNLYVTKTIPVPKTPAAQKEFKQDLTPQFIAIVEKIENAFLKAMKEEDPTKRFKRADKIASEKNHEFVKLLMNFLAKTYENNGHLLPKTPLRIQVMGEVLNLKEKISTPTKS